MTAAYIRHGSGEKEKSDEEKGDKNRREQIWRKKEKKRIHRIRS